ncbi:phenylacetone monooxygenase [Verticillium dahliae VdLs.17]|uniref:Phenylacetone monooxygenase n=1 Tax=Verticillium dahliae (strain VdLs.17 / ATCC MYA-4575 / FGSC 10137) TaxID=498257 RepID=G2X8N4_VERDV|nr:phenylacetone monooxygenase [Verticillium dahliae VdLs.17]EGY15321.1 phenylacetone monooxygenase [Verticillium dahliae VdLs.17]
MAEELDVLILGAGLSGINAAYRVRTELPNASLAVLEGRDILGGTWSFWKYPGFRCDAAMTNFGFHWHPWTHERKIIEGERIIEYVEDAVRTHGIDKHIRFGHRILSADWDSATARWTVEVDHGGQRKRFRAAFMLLCTGYYSYDRALEAAIPGLDAFAGTVAHPQWWPEDLDYAGKHVVIVGSGATTWTLFPTMAETAASVTVLQRSPSMTSSRASSSASLVNVLLCGDHVSCAAREPAGVWDKIDVRYDQSNTPGGWES